MTDNHPVIPPPELVRKWQAKIEDCSTRAHREAFVAKVFQLGADYELEQCRLWVSENCSIYEASELDVFRRPKPLSLKQQALQFLSENLKPSEELVSMTLPAECIDTIRQAIEQLPD